MQIFAGRTSAAVRERMRGHPPPGAADSRLFVALHMHAGDGNVHTNIPVHSDDYAMLQEANAAVARIMALARSLGGVISGEHGIGITKLEFLEAEEIAAFVDYKRSVDPEGRFNKGKLLPGADLRDAYTPSLQPAGRGGADPGADRDRRHLGRGSSTACAAASASRCARPMCRAPTCSTRRATRSSAPRS